MTFPRTAAASLAALGFLFAAGACSAQEPQTVSRVITVNGQGEVTGAPDMATVSAGVVTEADTASAALDENSKAMKAVIDKLKAANIDEKDIQTSRFSLNPIYDYEKRSIGSGNRNRIVGYTASNQVTVRVRDMAATGRILDAVAKSGANQMNGLSFGFENPDPMMDEARKDAVADARAKAELYASAAGVSLGRLMSLNEGGAYAPRPVAYAARAEAVSMDVPVAPGEQSITASVTLVYEIK